MRVQCVAYREGCHENTQGGLAVYSGYLTEAVGYISTPLPVRLAVRAHCVAYREGWHANTQKGLAVHIGTRAPPCY